MGNNSTVMFATDADKDDTGRYRVEISNDSGVGTCEIPVKVKGTYKSSFNLYLYFCTSPCIYV